MPKKSGKIGCVIAYGENHNNFGTSLQGYATIKKIRDLGYTPEMIRYNKKLSVLDKLRLTILMVLCGGTKGKMRVVKERINKILHKQYAKNIDIRTKSVNRYKEEKLKPFFKYYNGYEELREGSLNYDVVIVGSDQVWTPMGLYGKFFNLLFVDESVAKMSYASSFGVGQIPSIQTKQTKEYLERFDVLGVREIKGKEIVETLSNKKAVVVADPTLLLTREEWEDEVENCTINNSEPYIFCYLLGENSESREAVRELQQETGYKIITIRHLDEYVASDEEFGDEAPYDVSPNDFVKYIKEAQYVCTDSFHCTIFSILFHKKFSTFYRFNPLSKNSRNSRIDSLLEVLGLQDRLYKGDISGALHREINYVQVDERLSKFREESLKFLRDSLKGLTEK